MRYGLTGTMSTGKTTMVKALAEHDYFKGKEYKFFTERSKYLMSMGIPLNQSSTYKGQLVFFAERASELMQDNMVTDRTVLDVFAFSKAAEKEIGYGRVNALEHIKDELKGEYDILFYVPIIDEIPMENNGIRETNEDFRRLIDDIIRREFNAYKGRKYIIKATNLNDRIDEIVRYIKGD